MKTFSRNPLSGLALNAPSGRVLGLWIAALAIVALLLTLGMGQASAQEGVPEEGYYYTVQRGDTWSSVAEQVGLTVEELQAANPQAVRYTGWLITGEKLFIPAPRPLSGEEQYYVVQPGDYWSGIAEEFEVPMRLLMAVNPRSIRPGLVLYAGEKLLIPPQPGTSAPVSPTGTATPSQPAPTQVPSETPTSAPPTATPTATEAPTEAPTEVPTETPTETPTEEPSATPTQAPAATPTEVVEPAQAACPERFSDYPARFLDVLNGTGAFAEAEVTGVDGLLAFLETCQIQGETSPVVADLTGDGLDDLVLLYQENGTESPFRKSDLILFNGSEEGFVQAYRARAAGEVALLAVDDVNQDGQMDVVWQDTTCGASTCFDTVYIRSWDGSAWQDWTVGTITMAYAEVSLEDVDPAGSGQELVLTGGVYGSVGAGPQRSRTEVWGSPDGAPYVQLSQTFGASNCLYHLVIDANRAFAEDLAFEEAQALYEEAIVNTDLVACWTRPNELDELRSFSLYRLALLSGYTGDPETATALVEQLAATYPDQVYTQVAQLWLAEYQASGDPVAACTTVNEYAEEHPEVVEVLADYGYANPTFHAADVCPILDVEVPTVEPVAVSPTPEPAATEAAGQETPAAETEEASATETPAPEETQEEAAVPAAALEADLPPCPETLADYRDVLPGVMTAAQDDLLVVEAWLRVCDAMTDDRGAVLVYDLNQDSLNDLIVFPTIISDAGYGPGGAEGGVFIFHADDQGGYSLAMAPAIYGQPKPLAVGDANQDGRPELIWTVESCSTFCVTSVQAVRWDEENQAYLDAIQPGAAIAEGEVFIEPVPDDGPGQGQQIRLVGGVSGTPGGGLAVPHEEVWQSVDGAPYQRISWRYDREVEGSDCLGLRLVEADMALQASNVLGYGPAIQRYRDALEDPDLQACSLFGIAPEEELQLLQGLASFRLIQALALDGQMAQARTALALLQAGQPDSAYTQASTEWLNSFIAKSDPVEACQAVASIFEENEELWQITDHFGYDHPALAAEQICFTPQVNGE